MTQILTGCEARRVIARSLGRSVRAIAPSAGSEARTVLYDRAGRVAVACDGFEIAREAADEEGSGSIGARILKEVLNDARRDLGDGTARLACLIGGAYEEGVRLLESGLSAGALAEAMLRAQGAVEGLLRADAAAAVPGEIAACLPREDPELRDAVAAARAHAGADGFIELREDPCGRLDLETGRGFPLQARPVSAWLPPASPDERVELTAPYVLVASENLSTLGRLTGLLEGFATRSKALAIVARGASGRALETLVVNGRAAPASLAALQPTEAGPQAMAALEDLAVATGATVIDPAAGISLDAIRPAMRGRAGRLVLRPGVAVFDAPAGDEAAIAARCRLLAAERERQRHLSLDRERLARRIGRLRGAWAELRVGGANTFEMERRLAAARAALAMVAAAEGGTVAGGGLAFARVAAALEQKAAAVSDDAARGACRAIAAGCRAAARACLTPNKVPPADPLTVTAAILRRGVSAAATMLRIEAIIA